MDDAEERFLRLQRVYRRRWPVRTILSEWRALPSWSEEENVRQVWDRLQTDPWERSFPARRAYRVEILRALLDQLVRSGAAPPDVLSEEFVRLERILPPPADAPCEAEGEDGDEARDDREFVVYNLNGRPASEAVVVRRHLKFNVLGERVWTATFHLLDFLLRRTHILHGKCVGELGAGTGLLAAVLARHLPIRSLVVTDAREFVDPLAANLWRNIQAWMELETRAGTLSTGAPGFPIVVGPADWEYLDRFPTEDLIGHAVEGDGGWGPRTTIGDEEEDEVGEGEGEGEGVKGGMSEGSGVGSERAVESTSAPPTASASAFSSAFLPATSSSAAPSDAMRPGQWSLSLWDSEREVAHRLLQCDVLLGTDLVYDADACDCLASALGALVRPGSHMRGWLPTRVEPRFVGVTVPGELMPRLRRLQGGRPWSDAGRDAAGLSAPTAPTSPSSPASSSSSSSSPSSSRAPRVWVRHSRIRDVVLGCAIRNPTTLRFFLRRLLEEGLTCEELEGERRVAATAGSESKAEPGRGGAETWPRNVDGWVLDPEPTDEAFDGVLLHITRTRE